VRRNSVSENGAFRRVYRYALRAAECGSSVQPRFAEPDSVERIAHALEHIATALSAIDHNLQLLIRTPRSS
jgi:hypothetical protein